MVGRPGTPYYPAGSLPTCRWPVRQPTVTRSDHEHAKAAGPAARQSMDRRRLRGPRTALRNGARPRTTAVRPVLPAARAAVHRLHRHVDHRSERVTLRTGHGWVKLTVTRS